MNWLTQLPILLAHGPLMLITVAAVRGAAPREAGASMLVSATDCCDTIGGGRLEWEAIAHARERLDQAPAAPELLRLPLAASLGQCCGGIVWLLFERIAAHEALAWQARVAALEAGQALRRECSSTSHSSWKTDSSPDAGHRPESGTTLEINKEPGFRSAASGLLPDAWHFCQRIALPHFPVTIFGTGHVGCAIVRALLPLNAQIRWVDTREEVFPADLSGAVCCIHSDDPAEEVRTAPPGSFVLVLTHSHAIDLDLCAAGLRRHDLAYFGMIGSQPKRQRFEQQLRQRGLGDTALARLTCPIGIAGIRSKQPAMIAASVLAQLLLRRETLTQQAAQPRNTALKYSPTYAPGSSFPHADTTAPSAPSAAG